MICNTCYNKLEQEDPNVPCKCGGSYIPIQKWAEHYYGLDKYAYVISTHQMGPIMKYSALGVRIEGIGIVPYDEIRKAAKPEVELFQKVGASEFRLLMLEYRGELIPR